MNDSLIPIKGAIHSMDLTKEIETLDPDNFHLIRVYKCSPDRICIQIRTKGSILDHGKERIIVSSAILDRGEAVELIGALREKLDLID